MFIRLTVLSLVVEAVQAVKPINGKGVVKYPLKVSISKETTLHYCLTTDNCILYGSDLLFS